MANKIFKKVINKQRKKSRADLSKMVINLFAIIGLFSTLYFFSSHWYSFGATVVNGFSYAFFGILIFQNLRLYFITQARRKTQDDINDMQVLLEEAMQKVLRRSNKTNRRPVEKPNSPDDVKEVRLRMGQELSNTISEDGFQEVVPIIQSEQEVLNDLMMRDGALTLEEIDKMLDDKEIKKSKRILNYLRSVKAERELLKSNSNNLETEENVFELSPIID